MSESGATGSAAASDDVAGAEQAAGAHAGRPLLSDLIEYRRMSVAEDINFLKKNWMRIHRQWVPMLVSSETYYAEQDKLIGKLGATEECWVACDKESPFYIYGFLCGRRLVDGSTVVHFVFTRDEWRKRGVARGLLNHMGHNPASKIYATHWSNFLKPRFLEGKNVVYNPYILPSVHS